MSHYELAEKLGEGGMGVVYKARDARLGRYVALKVLPPGKASEPERRQRFVTEAKAASALNHPNILTVHEIGAEGGVDFIVTEYVEGQTLARLIPPRGFPAPQALRYAVSIADALAATHAAGVIHRDLKPANVMVTSSGLVKILDFGLARFVDPSPVVEGEETKEILTREGAVLGTFAYMSPEQAEGRSVDPRSDVFSFGALLYEMVTGRKAFARASPSATIAAVLRDEPKPACEISGNVPAELDRVISRCLRKDPAKRFQSMADLKVALELLDAHASGSTTRSVGVGPGWRTVLSAAACALIVAAVVGAWLMRRRMTYDVEPTRPVPLTSFGGRVLWPALSPDGNQVAFAWNGETQGSFDLYVKLVGPGAPVRLTSEPGTESSAAWSPDGRQIAFLRRLAPGRSVLAVIPALGGSERIVAEATSFGSGVSWSPDGKWLVVARRDSADRTTALFRVSPGTGEMTQLTWPPANVPGLNDESPTLSPDGRTLAYCRARSLINSELWTLALTPDLAPAGEPVRLTPDIGIASRPAWTPDGKRIVFSVGGTGWTANPALMVIPAAGAAGEKARRVLGGEGGEFPTFSRTGSLVFAHPVTDLNIWRLPLEGGRPGLPTRLVASTRTDGGPRFSPDGKRITFTSDRSGSSQVWLCQADGSRQVQLTSMVAGTTSGGSWSPDGERLAIVSNPEGQMDVFLTTPNGRPPQRLTSGPAHDSAPSWSRDGAWVYFGSNREGDLQVWKTKPDPEAIPVRITRDGGFAARDSADGRTLYFAKQLRGGGWSIWQVPSGGGEETELIQSIARQWFFDVTATGVYYVTSESPGSELRFHRFADRSDSLLLTLEKRPGFGVAACPDDSCVLFSSFDLDATELMYVERFQ